MWLRKYIFKTRRISTFFFEIFILQSVGYLKYNLEEIVELMMQLAY